MGMTHEKMQFAFSMAKHTHATMWDIERLLRYGATHGRICTDECNGPDYSWCRTDAQRDAASKNWQAYLDTLPAKKEKIRAKMRELGLAIKFQSDPRGHTVRVIPTDTRVSEIPVPTS